MCVIINATQKRVLFVSKRSDRENMCRNCFYYFCVLNSLCEIMNYI